MLSRVVFFSLYMNCIDCCVRLIMIWSWIAHLGLVDFFFFHHHHIGGPKLRKWYGAPDPMQEDGSEVGEDEASGLILHSTVQSISYLC